MAAPAAVLSILVKANTGQATTALTRIDAQLGGVEKNSKRAADAIGKVVKMTALIGGAAVVGGLVYAGKKAADFESQMSSLGAVSEATGKQMEAFRKQALKAGADTKFSALEAAAAQTELAKGGLSVRQIMRGGLRSALALAAAGEMELADAAEATVNAMKLFGLRGRDAMKVADAFATAANSTTADVSDFAIALKQGGSAAKASGLSFIETTAILESLAEAGIKGSDAGTSMKAMLAQLAAPTEKQQRLMKKLNLDFFDQHGRMKDITDVAGMLRDRLKGLTEEQRLQAVKTIAGTDGMRALLALYDAGPQKMGRFQRELSKQGTAADVAKKKQDNLKGALENLQGSVETIAIKVGTGLIPVMRTAADELTEFANDVGAIMDRKDLSVGEKLQKSLELAEVRAKPWIDKLVAAVEQANLPERIAKLISAATPILAEAAAGASVIAARSFVTGFLAADVWGRLAVLGWLFAKMGGRPGFLKVGATAGTAMGEGMAAGAGSAGVKGKLVGLMKGWGPTLAIALAATFGPELIKQIRKLDPGADALAAMQFGEAKKGAENFDELTGAVDKNRDALKRHATEMDLNRVRGGRHQAELQKTREKFDELSEPVRRAQRLISNMATGSSTSIASLRAKVTLNTERIKKALGEDTKAGKDALVKNFRAAIANIRTSMANGQIATGKGLREIERLMAAALQTMGFTPKQAITLARHQRKNPTSASTIGPGGQIRPRQRGGPINEGAPSGDSVPAMLERGEYVLNRTAVKKVGRQALDRLNFAAAPRFQGGGIVELLHPFNDPKGHGGSNSHLHVAMSTFAAVVALGKRLQRLGWLVGEHPAFGGIQGTHAATGYHPTGQAIDVNWPDAGQEAAKIRALLPLLGGAGGLPAAVAAPELARMVAAGPDSPLKTVVQGALDTARGAAQNLLESVTSGGVEGTEGVPTAGGRFNKAMLASLWIRAGGSPAVANTMAAIALAESGGNPKAVGPLTSYGFHAHGLWQIHPPQGNDFDPLTNAKYAIGKYNAAGFQPWEAYTNGNYRRFLQLGGMLGMQPGGVIGGGRPDYYSQFANPANVPQRQAGIGKLIRKFTAAKSPTVRKDLRERILKRAKGIGLPEAQQRALKLHSDNAAKFGEFADRASQLTDESAITETLQAELERRQGLGLAFPGGDQQAMVDQMVGRVGGKTQLDWLKDQLNSLFQYRNAIVNAEQKVVDIRKRVTNAIEVARKALERVRAQLKDNYARKKTLEQRLERLQKKPKRNKDQIKVTKAQLRGLNKHIGIREGVRDNLKDKVIPALTGKRQDLNATRGDLLSNLDEVQGLGGPAGRLATMPPLSQVGGTLFDVGLRVRELTDKPIRVVAEAGPTESDARRAELAEEIAAQKTRETALLAAQLPVLKDIPRLFGLPAFAQGGIVPGPVDSPRVVMAHGGEGVFTRDQMAALAGGSGVTNIRVIVEDGAVDPKRIRVIADGALNDMGARVGLGLQGVRRAPGDVAGLQ